MKQRAAVRLPRSRLIADCPRAPHESHRCLAVRAEPGANRVIYVWCADLSAESGFVRRRAATGCPPYADSDPTAVAAVRKFGQRMIDPEGTGVATGPILRWLREKGNRLGARSRDDEEFSQTVAAVTGIVIGVANPYPIVQFGQAGVGLVQAVAAGETNPLDLACASFSAAAATNGSKLPDEVERLRVLNREGVLVCEGASLHVTYFCTGRKIAGRTEGRGTHSAESSNSQAEPEVVAALVMPMTIKPLPVTLPTCADVASLTAADLTSIVELAGNRPWIEANLHLVTRDADRNWVLPTAGISWVKLTGVSGAATRRSCHGPAGNLIPDPLLFSSGEGDGASLSGLHRRRAPLSGASSPTRQYPRLSPSSLGSCGRPALPSGYSASREHCLGHVPTTPE